MRPELNAGSGRRCTAAEVVDHTQSLGRLREMKRSSGALTFVSHLGSAAPLYDAANGVRIAQRWGRTSMMEPRLASVLSASERVPRHPESIFLEQAAA